MKLKSLIFIWCVCTPSAFAQSAPLQNRYESALARKASPDEPVARKKSTAQSLTVEFGEQVVREMEKAWRIAGGGVDNKEVVILLFRMRDGSLAARLQELTNEHKEFTFKWDPAAIAILHTHPNSVSPRPSREDKRIADRLGVAIFTMTTRGLYMYEPNTKSISILRRGLDWLRPSILEGYGLSQSVLVTPNADVIKRAPANRERILQ